LKNFEQFQFFPWFAESIGVLHVKIGGTVQKLFKRGVFEKKKLPFSRKMKFSKILITQFCNPWFAESISVLHVKIGGTVQKLFNRRVFEKKKFPCSPKLKF
jgi:hypothetical protein